MNYTDIAPLESAGLSDEQIAAVLSSVTVRPVPLWAFENFLDEQGLGQRGLNLKWEGSLPSVASLPGELGEGVAQLFGHINKLRAEQIDTSIQDVKELIAAGRFTDGEFARIPWCLKADALLEGLIQAEVITEQHREGFYALGDGLKHGIVTVEQIDKLRTQHQFQARVTNATALFAERMKAGDDPAVVMSKAWEDAG